MGRRKHPVLRPHLQLSFLVLFSTIPVQLATGPATVSTSRDDLKESLNDIRLANPLSVEVDERVSILERCLTNVNRGQGIGFKVFDIVITRKMLTKIFLQIFGSVTFLATIILSARSQPMQLR